MLVGKKVILRTIREADPNLFAILRGEAPPLSQVLDRSPAPGV